MHSSQCDRATVCFPPPSHRSTCHFLDCLRAGNNRGNRYSHKHICLTPDDSRYWNFSIDELARYDVPALINHVLASTGFTSLRYIGSVTQDKGLKPLGMEGSTRD